MENKKLVTILTPTYNRGHLLNKLYESLLCQTDLDFEWMIIDDGSIDNTKEIVKKFLNDNFDVKYIYKRNGGKHTALNEGISRINTELIFIVDSDDWLVETAIEEIKKYYIKYKNVEGLGGFSFLRKYPDGRINVSTGSKKPFISSYINERIVKNKIGDMAEVYYTRVLNKYLFPVFENEKFISEDIVWIEISKKYNLLFIDTPIYVSNYLKDGLTKNRQKIMATSPKGSYCMALKLLEIENLPVKRRIKTIFQTIVYGRMQKKSFIDIVKKNKNICLSIFLYPLCLIYIILVKRKF